MNLDEIELFYAYVRSQHTAQQYLHQCYQKLNIDDAERKSYENCTTFLYYLEHGHQFYKNGKQLDYLLYTILFLYVMINLFKATLLLTLSNYPKSTYIISNDVSKRKRKPMNYIFMDDQVKKQYKVLFPYFSEHLFLLKTIPFEKIKMHQLLAIVPELSDLFLLHDGEKMIKVGSVQSRKLSFPCSILDHYHLTENTFIQRIKSH